jgi:hypothetical protein
MHIVSRLLTAASACYILFGLEASFVFLDLDCFVLCKSQDKMKQENRVPLNFKWMFSILLQLRILSDRVLFQKIFCVTLRLWREKYNFTLRQIYKEWNVLEFIEKTEVLAKGLRCWKLNIRCLFTPWLAEVLEDENAFIFNVNKFKVYQFTQHNTPEK